MKKKELTDFLNHKYNQFNNFDFIADDPIKIPHQFTKEQDIEIAGLFSAILAWGNRKSIIRNATLLMDLMDHQP